MARLTAYPWPGNVRELEHVLLRAVVAAREGGGIRPEHLAISEEDAVLWPLEEYVRRYLLRVLAQTRGVIDGERGAAVVLGVHPNTLRHRLQKLGIPFRKKDRTP